MLALLPSFLQPSLAQAPPGTEIDNRGLVRYAVDGITFTTWSNTDRVVVQETPAVDSAELLIVAQPAQSFPGDTIALDITINNTGANDLLESELTLALPPGSSLSLPAGWSAVEKAGGLAIPVPPIPRGTRGHLQPRLTLSAGQATGPAQIAGTYAANGNPIQAVIGLTVLSRTASTLATLRFAPGSGAPPVPVPPTAYHDGSGFVVSPLPIQPDGRGGFGDLLELLGSTEFHAGETIFARLSDPDQDKDPTRADTIVVEAEVRTGEGGPADRQAYRLGETGPDTGVFVGYLQTSAGSPLAHDGLLSVASGAEVRLSYLDGQDGQDRSVAVVLVDPFGRLFDSATGGPVDGVQITLVDATSGVPASVYGDNAVDPYPSTVTTGGRVTDAGGAVYDFPAGGFRFPLASPGQYRLVVSLPAGAGYAWPSAVAATVLMSLPGGPFVVDVGSRGEPFNLVAGPPLHLDIPIDPTTMPLWVSKQASKSNASAGDFLQYRVEVENTRSIGTIEAVVLNDLLPHAFRYQGGSTRIDGEAAADPLVSEDGRTLTFELGDLDPAARVSLSYVVGLGSVRRGPAVNQAQATGRGIDSNVARATVVVREDLLRSRNVLIGRVAIVDPATGQPIGDDGLPGARIFLEDGTYVVTDERGKFHFEGVRPGVHVVQLDLDTLPAEYEAVATAPNTRLAGRAWSQFVDLQGGTPWRVDFDVAPRPTETGAVSMTLSSQLGDGQTVCELTLALDGDTVPLGNLRLVVMLPVGSGYRTGSSRLGGATAGDPEVSGNVLTYRLGERPAGFSSKLALSAVVDPTASDGELVTKAFLIFDSPRQTNQRLPVIENILLTGRIAEHREQREFTVRPHFRSLSATLEEEDKPGLAGLVDRVTGLGNIRLQVVGHSDRRLIRSRSWNIFKDNQALSEDRARTVARYLQGELGLTPDSLTIVGRGATEPLTDEDSAAGHAQNRRVEVRVVADRAVPVVEPARRARHSASGSATVEGPLPGQPASEAVPVDRPEADGSSETDRYDADWIETALPGNAWLLPGDRHRPQLPSVHVGIKHSSAERPKLYRDGDAVSPLNFESRLTNKAGTVSFSLWRGVDLSDGDNTFEVVFTDESGAITGRMQRLVHYSGQPVRLELVDAESKLIADGITPPVVAVRLLDAADYPAREGSIGEFHLSPPYEVRTETHFDHEVMQGAPSEITRYVVGKDGVAKITLEPTTRVDDARLVFPLLTGEHELVVPLKPQSRDWILVGLAEGTIGHRTVEGHLESLPGAAGDEDLYADGRVAFYAKGRVKAKWLLTLAYDSEKETGPDQGMYGTIDPGTYYSVYGDQTTQRYEAASREKLYLKIERDVFSALFGDFDTGLTVSDLSRYNRSLTGLKSRYRDDRLDVIVFASDTEQSFARDEIRGEGITGPYRLSAKSVVLNSEKLTIEVRDRFKSETVISERTLSRHLEYDIDYAEGTVVLREAVPSTDELLNPVFLVIDYESYDSGEASLTYGARAQFDLGGRGQIGASHVSEDDGGETTKLYGADLEYHLTPQTRARVEYARTDGEGDEDDAYLAEVRHASDKVSLGAYYREFGEDFGLGQVNRSERGTRKVGAEGGYRVDDRLQLRGQVYRQETLETDATREVAEAETIVHIKSGNVRGGLRAARDDSGDGAWRESNQITAGITRTFADGKLNLRIDREQPIAGDDASADFPARTLLGLDHRLTPDVTLFVEQEWADGARDTRNSILGLRTAPWTGAEISTSVRQRGGSGPENSSMAVALRQRWALGSGWSIDTALENVETLSGGSVLAQNRDVPFAGGADQDFVAASVGTTYNSGKWMWTARTDYRDSDSEDRWGLATSIQTDPRSDLGVLLGVRLFETRTASGEERFANDVRLGLAYRPLHGRWFALDRLDWIQEEASGGPFEFDNWRIVNNLSLNHRFEPKWQLGLLYGSKYVRETIDATEYDGYTDVLGLETRYDLTPRWDVGVRGSVLHAWGASQYDYSAGASVGHSLFKNVWISLGYNVVGFEDRDFSRAEATAAGPFLRFRIKFDQQSIRELIREVGR